MRLMGISPIITCARKLLAILGAMISDEGNCNKQTAGKTIAKARRVSRGFCLAVAGFLLVCGKGRGNGQACRRWTDKTWK